MRIVFLRRPWKPLACFRTFLCLAWAVTPRLTRAIDKLLQNPGCGKNRLLAVRQEELLHVVRVALEHGRGAAQVADLLLGPLNHPVALAGLGVNDLAGAGDLEALFRARLRLQLGHLALLWSGLESGGTALSALLLL